MTHRYSLIFKATNWLRSSSQVSILINVFREHFTMLVAKALIAFYYVMDVVQRVHLLLENALNTTVLEMDLYWIRRHLPEVLKLHYIDFHDSKKSIQMIAPKTRLNIIHEINLINAIFKTN